MRHNKNRKGFTLIELIVVIAIIAIIAAVAVPTAFGSIENARLAACNANISIVLSEYRMLYADELLNERSTPDTPEAKFALLEDAYTAVGRVPCPSSGDEYTLAATDGVPTVTCEYHKITETAEPDTRGPKPDGLADEKWGGSWDNAPLPTGADPTETQFKLGVVYEYKGNYYECTVAHTYWGDSNWLPTVMSALWKQWTP